VRGEFEPWDNFWFCAYENGQYSEESGNIFALNEYTSITVRDIASIVGVE
jgi:hypothetical protein